MVSNLNLILSKFNSTKVVRVNHPTAHAHILSMFVSGGCDSLVKVWRQEQVGSWVDVRERFLLNLLNPDLTFWPPRSTRLSFTVAGCKTLSGCLGPRCRPFSCSCSLHQVCLDQEYEALNHTPDKDLPFWTCSCLEAKRLGLLCPGVYPSPDLLVWPLATSWTCSRTSTPLLRSYHYPARQADTRIDLPSSSYSSLKYKEESQTLFVK